MAKSNIIEFPMDRVRSFTTTTVVDETGPFTWYSTPGQTETLEEDYVTGLEWICIQSKELEEQSERLLALAELLLEGDEGND